MTSHPKDEWVEVTSFGSEVPEFLLARDGREVEIAEAKAAYIAGRITIEEFEIKVEAALQ